LRKGSASIGDVAQRLRRPSVGALCFGVSVGVYLVTRFVGLADYPVSFIGDEAVQVVDAANLVHHGFRDEFGDFLPTYVRNGPYLNLGVSVYLQILPYLVFGYSEVAARGVDVLVTLSGAVAVALLLRDVFRLRFWWVGALLLSIAPAWFLHSRTALEAPLGCSFYCWFLYLYLRFRVTGSSRALYSAVVLGALAFYSYAPLKVVVVATAVLLAGSDARFLLRHRRALARAAMLAVALALPEVRFQLQHSGANVDQLRVLGSYLVDPNLGVGTKIRRFLDEYALGLDPRYWYDPDRHRDLSRHVMDGYGNLWLAGLPFAAVGTATVLWRIQDARFRGVLLATVAAPLGPALVEIELPRSLIVVVPATILTALGLNAVLDLLASRIRSAVVAGGVLVLLAGGNVAMLVDSLSNGSTWTDDYGLYGLQYGGRQVAHASEEVLRAHPDDTVVISSTWANATDTVMRFFLPGEGRARVENLETTLFDRPSAYSDVGRTIFAVTEDELRRLRASRLFGPPRIVRTVELPDRRLGFAFVHLAYSTNAPQIFAAEQARLRQPVTETLIIDGRRTRVTHTRFDRGGARDLFDGDTFTLARTVRAPAMSLELAFASPRPLRSVRVVGREMALAVDALFEAVGQKQALRLTRSERRHEREAAVTITLGRQLQTQRLVLRIWDPTKRTESNIHVREIELRPR
jgi:hypothetical protein